MKQNMINLQEKMLNKMVEMQNKIKQNIRKQTLQIRRKAGKKTIDNFFCLILFSSNIFLAVLSVILISLSFFQILSSYLFSIQIGKKISIDIIILAFIPNQTQLNIPRDIMSLQAYQVCIQSLEKEIKSRQQERVSMAKIIESLDKQLETQLQKNKTIKQELGQVMKNNLALKVQLQGKESIIFAHKSQVNKQTGDNFYREKILAIEIHKKTLQEELKHKDIIINQNKSQIEDLQIEVKKNLGLIEGYRNILNEKAKQISKLQTKATQLQFDKEKLSKQLKAIRQQTSLQNSELKYRMEYVKDATKDTLIEYQDKIASLLEELSQMKELHKNELSTSEFSHKLEKKEFQIQISNLKKEVANHIKNIEKLRNEDSQTKLQYEAQTVNKDQMVNELIKEIGFQKLKKDQIQRANQIKLNEITQQILRMRMQKNLYTEKVKRLQEENVKKFEQMKILTKKLEASEKQTRKYEKELLEERQISFQRKQEIFELKSEIENLSNSHQAVKLETNTASQELSILRNNNIELQRSLLTARSQIQQQKLSKVQLEQKIKQYTYERFSNTQNKAQLQLIINNHQSTIANLQGLLEQSKRVTAQLNQMMRIKIEETDALQKTNTMFRAEKLEWLNKEEQYRKKILLMRSTPNNGLTKRSNRSDISSPFGRTHSRNQIQLNNLGTYKPINSPRLQSNHIIHSTTTNLKTQSRKKSPSVNCPQNERSASPKNYESKFQLNLSNKSNKDLTLSATSNENSETASRLMRIFGIKQLQSSQVEMVNNNSVEKTSDGKYQYKLSKQKIQSHIKRDHSGRLISSVSKKNLSSHE